MKYFLFIFFIFLSACATFKTPQEFAFKPMKAKNYTLATWQKITDDKAPVYIFLEGDGNAFNYQGNPTKDPTPKSSFFRELAFNNKNKNVVYLARPCQYIKKQNCTQENWTIARFSPEIMADTALIVKQIVKDREVVFIAYSGGALLSGLIIKNYPEIEIKKWITLAGLLNHKTWTEELKLAPLTKSLDLEALPEVEQQHYVGVKDKVIPIKLSKMWTKEENLIILPKARHSGPFELTEF